MDAFGNYPRQPQYEPVWDALEETGMVYGMHWLPAFSSLKPRGYSAQYSGAELPLHSGEPPACRTPF